MKTFKFSIYTLLFVVFVISSCKKDDFKPEDNFVKIYDEKDGNKSYFPLGIKRTSDNGYLILSAFNGWNIQVMKVNNVGDFVWKYNLPSNYINATPSLLELGGKFYFVCMDNVGLFSYLMEINETSQQATEVQSFPFIEYPTASYSNGNSIFIQNYRRFSYETGIYQLNTALTDTIRSGKVKIFDDVEERVFKHMTYTGKRMPFSVQTSPDNSKIVMSGFFNYSFSLVFLDQNFNFTGVYNGSNYNGGISAILPQNNTSFALARFSFSNMFYNPNVTLNTSAIDIAESIPAQGMPSIDSEKPVIIKELKVDGTNYTTFAASTHSNQLVLHFHDNTGKLKGTKVIGQNLPYTLCDVEATQDGGLILLVQTRVMSSYNRIATIKLTKEQVLESMEE
jgi:hypothetical protein